MDSHIYVKPLEGLLVRIPRTRVPLPQAGALVPLVGSEGNFWRRRLNDGTVVEATPPVKPSAPVPVPVREAHEELLHTRRRHNTNKED